MEKVFQIQKQVRENAKAVKTYLTDLQNWESEMKRKEAALNGAFEQDLPPVRSKIKKDKPLIVKKKPENRIPASDYKAWENFDVDKACEEVDMEEVGPVSLDGKKSEPVKLEKLREEAQYEKERGNTFVKAEKWDEAISCYNRAIELVKDEAIYFANRGLCYLKKDSLHQAETDCTEALRLDPTYVKALQRRATARERLGSLRAASHDLGEVLKLEPNNNAAKKQLLAVKARMGTKGSKSKSSPVTTPTTEHRRFTMNPKPEAPPKILELPDEPTKPVVKIPSEVEKWKDGVGENVTVIKTVKKPPHLRSKRALKSVPIQEILLGKLYPEKPATRMKIVEIDTESHGDTNNNDSMKIETKNNFNNKGEGDKSLKILSPESDKLVTDGFLTEKKLVTENCITETVNIKDMVPPINSVQFMSVWKSLKGISGARSEYLSIIEPSKIPSIFDNALDSDVVSELVAALAERPRATSVAPRLRALSSVKRFPAMAMFLSAADKNLLNQLLDHCRNVEKCSEDEIADLKNKFEL